MPIRVKKFRPKALIALVVLGAWAGLASGSMGAGAEVARPPVEQAASVAVGSDAVPASSVVAPPAADALAADEVAATDPASSAAALVPPDRMYLEPILAQAARDYGLPVDLMLAQAWAESGWRVDAVSNRGAVGVLQLMPNAVDFISTRLLKLDQPLDPHDPAANAHMAARFMRHLLDRLDGDPRQALIAYNQGLSGLFRKGPVPDAESYADKVLALRPVFAGLA
jgi:soluble lytic murein transglycosylase-like protein